MPFKKGQSGNPSGKKPGTRNRRSTALEAIRRKCKSVDEFWDIVVDRAIEGDAEMTKQVLSRLEPTIKPRSSTVHLNIKGDTAADYTTGVLDAVAAGELPPDEASSLLNAILAGEKLEKLEQLEQRIDELMEARHANH